MLGGRPIGLTNFSPTGLGRSPERHRQALSRTNHAIPRAAGIGAIARPRPNSNAVTDGATKRSLEPRCDVFPPTASL